MWTYIYIYIYAAFLVGMNVVNLSTRGRCMRACVSVLSKHAAISSITIEIRMGCFAFSSTTAIAAYRYLYILYFDSRIRCAEISVKSYRPIKNRVRGMCAIGNNGTTYYGWNTHAIMRHCS